MVTPRKEIADALQREEEWLKDSPKVKYIPETHVPAPWNALLSALKLSFSYSMSGSSSTLSPLKKIPCFPRGLRLSILLLHNTTSEHYYYGHFTLIYKGMLWRWTGHEDRAGMWLAHCAGPPVSCPAPRGAVNRHSLDGGKTKPRFSHWKQRNLKTNFNSNSHFIT